MIVCFTLCGHTQPHAAPCGPMQQTYILPKHQGSVLAQILRSWYGTHGLFGLVWQVKRLGHEAAWDKAKCAWGWATKLRGAR